RTSGPVPRRSTHMSRLPARTCCPICHPPAAAVPALHALGVRAQVSAGLEEPVVKVEVQVMSLDLVHDEHRRHRPRELAKRVEDVLRLPGDAGVESKRFHQREYLEFPQRADIGTGPLNAHVTPSQAQLSPQALPPPGSVTPVQHIFPRAVQPVCKWFVSDVKK